VDCVLFNLARPKPQAQETATNFRFALEKKAEKAKDTRSDQIVKKEQGKMQQR